MNKNHTDKNQINVRIDFTESSKSSWYGRYGWTDEGQFTGGIYLNGGTVDTRGHQALVDNTRVLSSTLVNEIRFGYNKFYNAAGTELNNVFDPIAKVGLKLPTTGAGRTPGAFQASALPDFQVLVPIPILPTSIRTRTGNTPRTCRGITAPTS